MLNINNLTKYYGNNLILENLNLQVDTGDVIRILGLSGAGKTTLLRCIAGLEKFKSGIIEINGITVQSDKIYIPPYKRKIGMVFQDFALWPHLTVYQNIDFVSSSIIKNKNELKVWNDDILSLFKIEHKKTKYPGELSGGEQQRVALARAIASRPQILLLDEPFSALDPELSDEIINATVKYISDNNTLLVIVSHADVNPDKFAKKTYKLINQKLSQ